MHVAAAQGEPCAGMVEISLSGLLEGIGCLLILLLLEIMPA